MCKNHSHLAGRRVRLLERLFFAPKIGCCTLQNLHVCLVQDLVSADDEWVHFFDQRVDLLVELFLVWKTSTGNLERRFRRFREIRCPQRAQLLDASVEQCMLVEQAPPSKMLRMQPSFWESRAGQPQADNGNYFQQVLKLHEKLHGTGPA